MRRRIHQANPVLRYAIGFTFLPAGLIVIALGLIRLAQSQLSLGEGFIALGFGLVFAFVGLCIAVSDYLIIDSSDQTVMFYEARLLGNAIVLERVSIRDLPEPHIEDYPNKGSKGFTTLYRVMLGSHVVREDMSNAGAERYRRRLMLWLKASIT